MPLHVSLGQLDPYREHADTQDHPRELQRDDVGDFFVASSPCVGVDEVGTIWTDDDAEYEGERSFTDIELVGGNMGVLALVSRY
jgi:hypothetical protein